MSFLDDRIARIMELRRQDMSDEDIAAELDVPETLVEKYEAVVRDVVVNLVGVEYTTQTAVAESCGLSLPVLQQFAELYDVELPPRVEAVTTFERRCDDILSAVINGAESLTEVADEVGLAESSVRVYAGKAGITIPGTNLGMKYEEKPSKQDRIDAIRDAVAEGVYCLDAIGEMVGLAPSSVRVYATGARIHIPGTNIGKGRPGRKRNSQYES